MKILASLKSTFKLATVSSAILAATSLTNCGGGGGGGTNSFTIRPKTLDGLRLTVGTNIIALDFTRSINTNPATANGSSESGSVIYLPGNRIQSHETTAGFIDAIWPASFNSGISYTYTALNDSAGILAITSRSGVSFDGDNSQARPVDANANIRYFNSATSETINFELNFEASSGTISTINTRIFPADTSNSTVSLDTNPTTNAGGEFFDFESPAGSGTTVPVRLTNNQTTYNVPSTLSQSAGGSVPTNYTTNNLDENSFSPLVLDTLGTRTLSFVAQASGRSEDFSISFSNAINNDPEEGDALFNSAAGSFTMRTISNAGRYVYQRNRGTDTATITLSGGDPALTMELTFQSAEGLVQLSSGTYTITNGTNANQTGDFSVIAR